MNAAIFALALAGAPPQPAQSPQIDLWTMGPGEHPYERFGHAAMRVRDGDRDLLYNFGISDFDRPEFLLDFLRGRSAFWLDVESPTEELEACRRRDRQLYSQPLLLATDRAEWLARKLRVNSLPANRNYAYHHFRDNCTTRLRDLIDEATGGKLAYLHYARTEKTYRQWTREGLAGLPALLFATEFLGRPMDRTPDRWERMFHPDALREEVAGARIAGPTQILNRRHGPSPLHGDVDGVRRVLWAAAAIAAAAIFFLARRGGLATRLAMALAGIVSAAISLPLGVIALISRQDEFRHNEMLLVFWPVDLLLLAGPRPIVQRYLRIRAGMAVLLVLYRADGLLGQDNWPWLALGVALMAALDLGLRGMPATPRVS